VGGGDVSVGEGVGVSVGGGDVSVGEGVGVSVGGGDVSVGEGDADGNSPIATRITFSCIL
jgi:hypothetical protein